MQNGKRQGEYKERSSRQNEKNNIGDTYNADVHISGGCGASTASAPWRRVGAETFAGPAAENGSAEERA